MGLFSWFSDIFKSENSSRVVMWDPERLSAINQDTSYSKQIRHPKNIYYSQEIKSSLGMRDRKGRKVKVWRLVKSAYDEMNDEYIPLYYRRKKHKNKKNEAF